MENSSIHRTISSKDYRVFGTPDFKAVEQLENVLQHPKAVKGALMADNHLGYSMPIGGVVVYDGAISPTGVGFDIACGNMAVKTDLHLSHLDLEPIPKGRIWDTEYDLRINTFKPIMRQIQKQIAFGIGRKNPTPIDHVLFESDTWKWINEAFPGLKEKAADQLGTVGSGNHYVDLLVDESGHIWVANHFGSRGLGHTIASGFMALAQGRAATERVPETEEGVVFDTDSEIGAHYIAAMQLAGEYAYAGREYVIDQVLKILGAKAKETIHNHHNYAWLEDGYWVVRKGATPLTIKPAFIGGSMGDVSVIVRGKSEPIIASGIAYEYVADVGALGSAPHGAGRIMSRTQAAGKMRKMWFCSNRECDWSLRATPEENTRPETCPKCGNAKFRKIRARDKSTALVDWDIERQKLNDRGIVVLGGGADESPSVYKSLKDVILAHSNIEVLHTLRPIGVVMASPDEKDPYKD